MLLILLVITLIGILLWEGPKLVMQKDWKFLIVFLLFWSFTSALAIAQFIGIDLEMVIIILNTMALVPPA